jgi:hypothetical protein
MAREITIKGQPAKPGDRMTKAKGGGGWRLATISGKKRVFAATLLTTFNFGNKRIAVFSVPK